MFVSLMVFVKEGKACGHLGEDGTLPCVYAMWLRPWQLHAVYLTRLVVSIAVRSVHN